MRLHEFIDRQECISFDQAILLLKPIYLLSHNWNVTDNMQSVSKRIEQYIRGTLLRKGVTSKKIIGNCELCQQHDEYGFPETDPITGDIIYYTDTEASYVNVRSLMTYVFRDIGDINCIPNELQHLIDEELLECASELIDTKYDPKIDKLVCQGIAKTLWDIDPELTIKAISNHRAIQVYGNGKQYKDPKTVSGWISQVDPRPSSKKRGKKKVDDPKAISE